MIVVNGNVILNTFRIIHNTFTKHFRSVRILECNNHWKFVSLLYSWRCQMFPFHSFIDVPFLQLLQKKLTKFCDSDMFHRATLHYLSGRVWVYQRKVFLKKYAYTQAWKKKKKGGGWSPPAFFYPSRVVSYRWSKK